MTRKEQKCITCGFTCDLADAGEHFYRASKRGMTATGYAGRCKRCWAKMTRDWKRANSERNVEYMRRYRARKRAEQESRLQEALAAIQRRKGA